MSTREQLRQLCAAAVATGEALGDLEEGLSALVRTRGPRRQIIFRRAGAPIGLVEAICLRAEAGVPDHAAAVRYPPTSEGLHRLSLTWEAEEQPASLFDLPPAPAAPPPDPPAPSPSRSHVWRLLETGEPLPDSLPRVRRA